uniref:Putative secreted protein n=1 Tax=Rhipicephalus microplus TaxID=6941 RepID=A0A6G5A1V5_RHIMP
MAKCCFLPRLLHITLVLCILIFRPTLLPFVSSSVIMSCNSSRELLIKAMSSVNHRLLRYSLLTLIPSSSHSRALRVRRYPDSVVPALLLMSRQSQTPSRNL